MRAFVFQRQKPSSGLARSLAEGRLSCCTGLATFYAVFCQLLGKGMRRLIDGVSENEFKSINESIFDILLALFWSCPVASYQLLIWTVDNYKLVFGNW